jgi:acyl-CoA reductase-like NAD-dependent aldehyde dehydrogenase
VVAVSAFNHPLNLIVHQVAPAVATGCPVLVKPADDTPLSCEIFVKLLYEAGLPEEWCRFVPCDLATAEQMVTDPRVAFFSFIGSAKVGWMLRSKLAAGTRCALEHGGAAPVIVDDGADLSVMIPKLIKGGFYHSGQVCVSVQRIFAPKAQAEQIAGLLAESAKKLVVGNAILETTDLDKKARVERCDELLERFGIAHLSKNEALTLSGGEKRRLTIARSLVTNPKLLMLDEPFSGVDPIAVYDVQQIVSDLRDMGLAIIITDHNVRETLAITDRAYLIFEGRVESQGDKDFLLHDPISRKLYLGESFAM